MKTLKYEFTVSTRYVGSQSTEEYEIEVEDGATAEEIEIQVEAAYKDWVSNEIEGGWKLIQ